MRIDFKGAGAGCGAERSGAGSFWSDADAEERRSLERSWTRLALNLKGIPATRSASTTTLSPTEGNVPTTVLKFGKGQEHKNV